MVRKIGIITFLIYQLTNSWKNQLDFGVGLFDESGILDQCGIQKLMRSYLFKFCFGITAENPNGAKIFIDYILANYERAVGYGGLEYKPDIGQIAKILGENELRDFWQLNGAVIKEKTKDLTGVFPTWNYTVDYQAHLPELFSALDDFSSNPGLPSVIAEEEVLDDE